MQNFTDHSMLNRLIFVWIIVICFVCGCTGVETVLVEQPTVLETIPNQTPSPTPDMNSNIISLKVDFPTKALLTYLVPFFENETGYQLELVDMFIADNDGTTQNHYTENTTQTDCKVICSVGQHNSEKEVFYQCYALFGPPRDPALVRNASNLAEAFSRIKSSQIMFTTESYSWDLEQAVWGKLGNMPDPKKDCWYHVEYFDTVASKTNYFDEKESYILDNIYTCAQTENLTLLYTDTFDCKVSYYIESSKSVTTKADSLTAWLRSAEGRRRIEWYNFLGPDTYYSAPYFAHDSEQRLADYYFQYNPAHGKEMYELIRKKYRGRGSWVEFDDTYCGAEVLPDAEWEPGSTLPALMREVPLNYPANDIYTNSIGSKKLHELAPNEELDEYFRLAKQAAQYDIWMPSRSEVFSDNQNKPVFFTDDSMIYYAVSGNIRVRGAYIFKSSSTERYYITIREFEFVKDLEQMNFSVEDYEIWSRPAVSYLEIDKSVFDEFIKEYDQESYEWR